MRVTTNNMYTSIMDSTNRYSVAMNEQIARSQYRVLSAGDDPVAQKRITNLNHQLNKLNNYVDQAVLIESKLNSADTQFTSYYDRLLEFTETIAKSGGGEHSEEDYKVFGSAVRNAENDMAAILNYRLPDGTYMFGGTETDKPPFVKETVEIEIDGEMVEVEMFVYQGNGDLVYQKAGDTSDIPVTIDGSKLVTCPETGKTIFEQMAIANYYFEQGEDLPDDVRDEMNGIVDSITDGYIAAYASLGANMNTAQANFRMYESMQMEHSKMLSHSQDANLVEVTTNITKYSQLMNVSNSTAKVLMDMQNHSFLG